MKKLKSLMLPLIFITSFAYSTPLFSNGYTLFIGEIIKDIQQVEQKYTAPGYSCFISLETSAMGGFLEMNIVDNESETKFRVKGVNSIVAVGDEKIIYTVSSSYGKFPAISVYNCKNNENRILDQGNNVITGYPGGSDYYEIVGFKGESNMVDYYYAKDINKIDFSSYAGVETRSLTYNKDK